MQLKAKTIASFIAALGVLGMTSSLVLADDETRNVHDGRASVYQHLHPDSLEDLSTPASIKAVTMGNVSPSRIWKVLEHGERVECLDCIPGVKRLLWNNNAKTREIAAWWLRRRIFGVFGPGEVYPEVVTTLHQSSDERQRAYAAEALGEFLVHAGVKHVAQALVEDTSPMVRLSAARALTRLNHQGPNGELAAALSDSDTNVRLAALEGALRIHVFTGVDSIVKLIDDPSYEVRRRAARTLGAMRASDAVVGLILLTSPDSEPEASVRAAAVAALGRIADASSRDAVSAALDDPDQYVRDAARIALQRF